MVDRVFILTEDEVTGYADAQQRYALDVLGELIRQNPEVAVADLVDYAKEQIQQLPVSVNYSAPLGTPALAAPVSEIREIESRGEVADAPRAEDWGDDYDSEENTAAFDVVVLDADSSVSTEEPQPVDGDTVEPSEEREPLPPVSGDVYDEDDEDDFLSDVARAVVVDPAPAPEEPGVGSDERAEAEDENEEEESSPSSAPGSRFSQSRVRGLFVAASKLDG